MKTNTKVRVIATTAVLIFAGVAMAQGPTVTVSGSFPNLRAAQEAIVSAYQKLDAAQAANKDKLGGHAEKAKALLMQADSEVRAAAEVSAADHK